MKKKIAIILVTTLVASLMLIGCGKSDNKLEKDIKAAKTTIEKVKTDSYMKEDQKEVEKLIKDAEKEIEKAKDKKAIEEAVDKFDKAVKKIPTREAQIKAVTKAINDKISALSDENKAKAEEILKSYEKQLKEVKSKADLDKISKEITDKISSETGETIEAVKSEEVSEEAAKETGDSSSSSSSSSSSNSSSSSSSSSSSNSSSNSSSSSTSSGSSASNNSNSSSSGSSTTPSKKQVWVVDKAAWTETVTKYREETEYRPTWWCKDWNNNIHKYYSEQDAYNAYSTGDMGSWGTGEYEAYTVEVPYTETIKHPEEGHYEWQ